MRGSRTSLSEFGSEREEVLREVCELRLLYIVPDHRQQPPAREVVVVTGKGVQAIMLPSLKIWTGLMLNTFRLVYLLVTGNLQGNDLQNSFGSHGLDSHSDRVVKFSSESEVGAVAEVRQGT